MSSLNVQFQKPPSELLRDITSTDLLLRCIEYIFYNNNFRRLELTVILPMMNPRIRPFFKGLPSFVHATDQLEEVAAKDSVYHYWWKFLRLSPVIWFAGETGLKPTDAAMAQMIDAFGDLRDPVFPRWWRSSGRKIFAEAKRPDQVKRLELALLHEHPFDKSKLYLEVPLTIRKQTILRQFKEILFEAHEGRDLDLMAHSNAEFKLHNKRYRLPTIEAEYWVLLYRLLYPKIEVWRIGDRLQVAPHHRVRDGDGRIDNLPTHALNSLTGRYLYKARFTLLNAERGTFPNANPIEVSSRQQPFGTQYQKAFRAATQQVPNGEVSEWSRWLHAEFADSLETRITSRHRFKPHFNAPAGSFNHRVSAFISGESDLLA